MMFPPEIAEAVQRLAIMAIPLILAITLHEAAHGYAALRFGDDTALRMGRISANPLHHIDPLGTILFPGMMLLTGGGLLFGWAKPVPVNFGRLKPQRLGVVCVALAGPGTNILLAVLSGLLAYELPFIPDSGVTWATETLRSSIDINLTLAVLNMLPIPPLDGGRVLVAILPRAVGNKVAELERYSLFIFIGLLFVLPMLLHVDILGMLLLPPVIFLKGLLLTLLGLS